MHLRILPNSSKFNGLEKWGKSYSTDLPKNRIGMSVAAISVRMEAVSLKHEVAMIALQNRDLNNVTSRVNQRTDRQENTAAVPAERVQYLLREIAIALHATRVIGWKDGSAAPKKG